jgi:hypothetical protein
MTPFTVLTEFRFDIGHAMLNSNQLQTAVQGLTNTVDNALISFTRFSASFISGSTGITGFFSAFASGVQAADKFQNTALKFANIISANRDKLTGPVDSFNDRLLISESIMKNIADQANSFALSGSDLTDMVGVIAPVLVSKGLAGTNMNNAIDLSRNLLKSAPVLNVSPYEVQGQLQRSIEGGASMGDTLFMRLVNETKAFKDLKGNVAQAFNKLPEVDRFKRLSNALATFASDADVLSGRTQTLTGQIARLKAMLSPSEFASNIFRPLGDALTKPIVGALGKVNDLLNVEGRAIIKNFATVIGVVTQDTRGMLINALALRDLGANVNGTKSVLGIMLVFQGLKHIGITTAIMWQYVVAIGGLLKSGFLLVLPKVAMGVTALGGALTSLASVIFIPMILLMALFHMLSRARAIARVNDAAAMPALMAETSTHMARIAKSLSDMFSPIMDFLNYIAGLIAPVFELSNWVMLMNWALNHAANLMAAFVGAIQGLGAALGSLYLDITSGKFVGSGDRAMHAFMQQFMETMEISWGTRGIDGRPAAVQNVNVGKVEIHNDFKENAEPDRIAFTIKEQLLKAATNPTQAKGRSSAFGAASGRGN